MSKPSERDAPDTQAGDPGEKDTFMLRWARRKASGRRDSTSPGAKPGEGSDPESVPESGDAAPRRQASEEAQGQVDRTPGSEPVEAEAETAKGDDDMPPLDSIDDGGSVAEFFSARVSPGLRKAALRRLFGQATLPVVDELDDYAGDYTKFTKLGDIVTSEMRYRLEVARRRLLARADEAADDEAGPNRAQVSLAGSTPARVPQPASPIEPGNDRPAGAQPAGERPADDSDHRASREAARETDAPGDEISTNEGNRDDPDPG